MRYEGDVDAIYEQRLDISDLDIEGFDDIGDDPGYWLGGDDYHPEDVVECQRCGSTMKFMNSHGFDVTDIYCQGCWAEIVELNAYKGADIG
jgi:hypothetical protein